MYWIGRKENEETVIYHSCDVAGRHHKRNHQGQTERFTFHARALAFSRISILIPDPHHVSGTAKSYQDRSRGLVPSAFGLDNPPVSRTWACGCGDGVEMMEFAPRQEVKLSGRSPSRSWSDGILENCADDRDWMLGRLCLSLA